MNLSWKWEVMDIFFIIPGFPHGIESIEKVLNFKISFQDLEKVLNLAKMPFRYWKSMEIPNGKDQKCVSRIVFE